MLKKSLRNEEAQTPVTSTTSSIGMKKPTKYGNTHEARKKNRFFFIQKWKGKIHRMVKWDGSEIKNEMCLLR